MKKSIERLKGFIAGFVMAIAVTTVAVVAASGGADAVLEIFRGVNVVVNGDAVDFAPDLQPFIANGRTYLPVRAIADALEMPVRWDEDTSTVYLGNRPLNEATLAGRWRVVRAADTFGGNTMYQDVSGSYKDFFTSGVGQFIEPQGTEQVLWNLSDNQLQITFVADQLAEFTMQASFQFGTLILIHETPEADSTLTLTLERVN